MKKIKARDLLDADRGVEIVTRSVGQITYVGWLDSVQKAEGGSVLVGIEDFAAKVKISVLLSNTHTVHVTPFEELEVGDLVGHRRDEHPRFGKILKIARDSTKRRVYWVQWDDEPTPRWHVRRALVAVTPENVEARA